MTNLGRRFNVKGSYTVVYACQRHGVLAMLNPPNLPTSNHFLLLNICTEIIRSKIQNACIKC